MTTDDDATLLRRYAAERSQAAFAEFVRRQLPLVFSAALRRLNGDVHRVSDVAQIVFIGVAQNATKLSRHPALVPWLYTATRHAVVDIARQEGRRLTRESVAHSMHDDVSNSPDQAADWQKLRPIIDDALDRISNRNREAVLLRFFQNQPYAEIGQHLRVSEDAARKRVERAVEELKIQLRRRGISSTSAALASLLATETIVGAPAGLAVNIVGSAPLASAAFSTFVFATLTPFQTGILAAILLGGAAGLSWQGRTIAQLKTAHSTEEIRTARAVAETRILTTEKAAHDVEAAARSSDVPYINEPTPIRGPSAAPATLSGPLEPPHSTFTAQPRDPQQRANLHRRYDPFLIQRGLSMPDIDRWIELMMEKENARLDLQEAMRDLGVPGGTPEIEALRTKLTEPLWKQMRSILGEAGFEAFHDFEQTSAYGGTMEVLQRHFAAESAALTDEQADRLVRTLIANNHPERVNSTDLGATGRITWAPVAEQASHFLTPPQQKTLSDYIQQTLLRQPGSSNTAR